MKHNAYNPYRSGSRHPGNCTGSDPPACPGMLEIKAAGNTIHIHYLTCKKQARILFALHCIHIDLCHIYSPQVTNSSLKVVLPLTSKVEAVRSCINVFVG